MKSRRVTCSKWWCLMLMRLVVGVDGVGFVEPRGVDTRSMSVMNMPRMSTASARLDGQSHILAAHAAFVEARVLQVAAPR